MEPPPESPVPGTLRRLLLDLEREIASLSSDNAALRREVAHVQQQDPGGRGTCGYLANSPAGPGSSLWAPTQPPEQPADCKEAEAGAASAPAFGSFAETYASEDSLLAATTPPQPLSQAATRQWQQQFDRLRSGRELLAAHDLWVVVSRHEHQLYGHNKHPLRTVGRTVRLIRQAYDPTSPLSPVSPGGEESPLFSLESHRMSCVWESRRRSCSWESNASPEPGAKTPGQRLEAALDWDAFLAFMADEDSRVSEEEGGDAEYLRKALRAEANEYMTEEARREIAQRQEEEVDPRPSGWLALLLEQLPPLVILANAVCLGLQSDMESPAWEVFELFFVAFYLLEVCLKARFLGCHRFLRGSEARWNIFDVVCILFSLTDLVFKGLQAFMDSTQDPSLLAVLKFFRLARLARIIKSFRSHYFDDLKTMSYGILSGAKVLAWAVILFFACIFVLGVVMKELVGHMEDSEEFRSVPAAMFSVFRCLTDDCSAYNGTPLHEKMRQQHGARFMIPYMVIFLVVNFGLFNLIVAVFIDRVVSISMKTKQQDLGRREREMRATIEEMIVSLLPGYTEQRRKTVGSEGSSKKGPRFNYGKSRKAEEHEERLRATAEAMQQLRDERVQISRELFSAWLTDPEVLQLLEGLEIDTATKAEIFDVCDVDKSGSLTCDELANGLMRLRGPISKCDVIAIRLKVRYLTKILEDIHHVMGA